MKCKVQFIKRERYFSLFIRKALKFIAMGYRRQVKALILMASALDGGFANNYSGKQKPDITM